MHLITRKQWRAAPPTAVTHIGSVHGIAVHYSASRADETDSHAQCHVRVKAIQRYHMSPGGHDPTMPWADIAYNFLLCRHGYVFEGRGWGVRSAAQGTNDGNDHYHAICFLGNDKEGRDDVTTHGRQALAAFVHASLVHYPNAHRLRPHNSFHSTGCPGAELERYLKVLHREWGLLA